MFEQTFKNIDDILYKDAGADSECRDFDNLSINIKDYKIIRTEGNDIYVSIEYYDYNHNQKPTDIQFYTIKNNID